MDEPTIPAWRDDEGIGTLQDDEPDAMSLLGADYTYSDMADNRHDDFVELVNSEVFAIGLESQQEPKP